MTLDIRALTSAQLAKTIDHSLLRPELTDRDVIDGCAVAARYHTATVCVKPCHVALAADCLRGSDVLVSAVVGFPHGAHATSTKVAEAEQTMADGAVELDMVLNIGALRSGALDDVRRDIAAVVDAAHARGARVKVILENAYLTDDQKIAACRMCDAVGADWVKTSTGYAPTGATAADIRLMRANVSERVQVKAAQGVRTLDAALEMIAAGATRIGATATAAICDEFERRLAEGR